MNRYNEYKDSGVKWMGEIPKEWKANTLRAYITMYSEKNHPEKQLLSVTREMGVIIRNTESKEENHNYIPDDLSGYKLVREGNFVINKMKSWQGSYGVSKYEGIVSPAYYVCELEFPFKKFFSTAIRSKAYVPFFTQYSKGIRVDQWDLSPIALKNIPFFEPPLEEQHAIVSYLDGKVGKIDQYIEAAEKKIKALEELKQTIISDAVTHGINPNTPMKNSNIKWIGNMPEHWKVIALKRVVSLINEKTTEIGLPYIALEYIESYTGKLLPLNDVEPESVCNKFQRGDVLFCKLRPYLTKCIIAQFEGKCTSELLVLRNIIGDNKFLNYVLLSPKIIAEINASTYGSKMPRANWNFIGACSIPFPPLSEQHAIVCYIDRKVSQIEQLRQKELQQIGKLKEYKQRLISDVVTGKVKVPNIQ